MIGKRFNILTLFTILLLSPAISQAQPAPEVDAEAAEILAALATFQTGEKAAHGVYTQFLRSHDQVPSATAKQAPKAINKAPDRLTKEYRGVVGAKARATSQRIDVYDGPKGKGYVVTFKTEKGGSVWIKRVNVGPETYRDTKGWLETSPIANDTGTTAVTR